MCHSDPRIAVGAASALLRYAGGEDVAEVPAKAKGKKKKTTSAPTEPLWMPPPGPADMTQAEWLGAVVEAWNANRGSRPEADPPSPRTQRRDDKLLTFRLRFPDPAEWGDASRAIAADDWHGRRWVDGENRLRSTLGWFVQDTKGAVELWHERGRAGRRDGWRVHQDPGPAYLSESDKLRRDALEMQRAEDIAREFTLAPQQGTLVPITGGRR
jgi:hypothetical protein